MYQYTTPTITLTFTDVDFTEASSIAVTFTTMKDVVLLEKTDPTVTATTLTINLTQEETAALPVGKIKVQVNWLYDSSGTTMRACSKKGIIEVKSNLKKEEM